MKTKAKLIYLHKLEGERISKVLNEKEKLKDIKCAEFAADAKKAYNHGVIFKTFKKIPFYINVLNCASKSKSFSSSITTFKSALKSLGKANVELVTSIIKDPTFSTTIVGIYDRVQNGAIALYYLIQAINKHKNECLFKGMPGCAYLKGVIKGYVLKLLISLAGGSY